MIIILTDAGHDYITVTPNVINLPTCPTSSCDYIWSVNGTRVEAYECCKTENHKCVFIRSCARKKAKVKHYCQKSRDRTFVSTTMNINYKCDHDYDCDYDVCGLLHQMRVKVYIVHIL